MVTRYFAIPAAMLSILIVCEGCFPTRFHETPEIHGRVFDFVTGAPLRNVAVTAQLASPRRVNLVSHTGADGRFDLAETASTAWLPLGFDLAYSDIAISFEAEGYVPQKIQISPFQRWDGNVQLRPTGERAAGKLD